jgi:hypothetical protein
VPGLSLDESRPPDLFLLQIAKKTFAGVVKSITGQTITVYQSTLAISEDTIKGRGESSDIECARSPSQFRRIMASARPYEIVVWGATGFTASLNSIAFRDGNPLTF